MKKPTLAVAVITFLIAVQAPFTGHRSSAAPNTGIEIKIPFDKLGHFVLLKAKINGSQKTYNFIVDTGAITIIDKDLANELGLKKRGPMAKISTLEVAGYQMENVFCYTGFDLTLFKRLGTPIHGIIGSNLLDRYSATFDFKSRLLVLSTHASTRSLPKGAIVIPFRDHPMNKSPIVKLRINGSSLEGMIDTGQPFPLVLPIEDFEKYKDGGLSAVIRSKGVMVKWPMTKPDHNYMTRLKSIKLGSLAAKDIACVFGELPPLLSMPLIGMDLLTQYRVTIDYLRHEIVMVAYSDAHIRDNYYSTGLNINLSKGDSTFVEGVWEGSAADMAGIRAGDVIIAFNNRKATAADLPELLDLMRNDDVKSIEFEVMNANGTKRVRVNKTMLLK